MRSDTAAQIGATLFFTVLMTAALIFIDRAGPPMGTTRFPSARVGDSHDVLRVPLTLADRLGEAAQRRTPAGGKGAAAKGPGTPAITAAGPTLQSSAGAPDGRRASSRAPDPATTHPQGENPSRPGDTTRPAAKHDGRGRSGAVTHGRGRDGAIGLTKGQRDGAPKGTADKARQKHTAGQRDHPVKTRADKRERKSVHRKPDSARRR